MLIAAFKSRSAVYPHERLNTHSRNDSVSLTVPHAESDANADCACNTKLNCCCPITGILQLSLLRTGTGPVPTICLLLATLRCRLRLCALLSCIGIIYHGRLGVSNAWLDLPICNGGIIMCVAIRSMDTRNPQRSIFSWHAKTFGPFRSAARNARACCTNTAKAAAVGW